MLLQKRVLILGVVFLAALSSAANAQTYGSGNYGSQGRGAPSPTYDRPLRDAAPTNPYGQPYNGLNGLTDTGGSSMRNGAPPPGSLLAPRR